MPEENRQNAKSSPCSAMPPRNWGLDVLRIALAGWVLLFHMHGSMMKCHFGWGQAFVRAGAVSMTGFFLLSGFALYGRYRENFQGKTFFLRRFFSVYPLYFVSAVLFVVFFDKSSMTEILWRAPIELLGLATLVPDLALRSHSTGTWFMSCILVCYLAFPALRSLVNGLSNVMLAVVGLIVAFLLMYVPFAVRELGLDSIYSNPAFRVCEFFLGMLAARLAVAWRANAWFARLLAVGACAGMFVGVSYLVIKGFCIDDCTADYMAYSVLCLPLWMVLLAGAFRGCCTPLWGGSVIKVVSSWSYAVFLAQLFSLRLLSGMDVYWTLPNGGRILVALALNMAMAIVLYYAVQRPIQEWSQRPVGRDLTILARKEREMT